MGNDTIRIYGKVVNTWTAWVQYTDRNGNTREHEIVTQYEVKYTEYNKDGSYRQSGTEDFSRERYNTIQNKWVYTWDGHQMNRGGKRKFEDRGMVKFDSNHQKDVMRLMHVFYPDAELIQLR